MAAEIFSRTANGCGHRQIAMCIMAEEGAVIADKTVLKMMLEMGIRCGIRRETAYHRYSSYRGVVGRTFENVIARDFDAGPRGGSWEHSDRGWQYQHASYTSRLEAAGIVQSMSRKANCIDNAATEQLFGHVKDEFYRGREWKTFEDFKRDPEEYIVHWNTSRRQVRLKGLPPEESGIRPSRPSRYLGRPRFGTQFIFTLVLHSWIDRKETAFSKESGFL